MCGPELCPSEKRAGAPSSRRREIHDANTATIQHAVDWGVYRTAAADFRQNGRRDANESPLFVGHLQDRAGAIHEHGTLS